MVWGVCNRSYSSNSDSLIISTLTLTLGKKKKKKTAPGTLAKINLIDLAGSERLSKTDATGDRLR